jgi:outer membrane protein assembly factor BamB
MNRWPFKRTGWLCLLVTLSPCHLVTLSLGADWPQFQGPGPDRANASKETGLLKEWPEKGPKLLWTFKEAGVGYSGPALVGDRVYLCGADKENSYLIALDLAGKEKWRTKLGKRFTFKGNQWGDGPRVTPTVADGLIYALDGGGELLCAQVADGKEVWRTSLLDDLKGEVNDIGGGPKRTSWGFCGAPLVDGDRLIVLPGGQEGTVAALNRKKGTVLWRSKELTDTASYASPVAAEIGGVRQYLVLVNRGLGGVAAENGKLLWYYEKKPPFGDVLIPTPIYHNGNVLITDSKSGCDLVKVTADGGTFKAAKLKAAANRKSMTGGFSLVGGHAYGYFDRVGLVCLDMKDLKEKWKDKAELGDSGSVTYADGHLYGYGIDDGVVRLVEANPEGWKLKGSFELPEKTANQTPGGRYWTYPVVADGKLFIRDQELLFCYDVKK